MPSTIWGLALHVSLVTFFTIRILLRRHRDPASRVAWLFIIAFLPFLGILFYILFGELKVSRNRMAQLKSTHQELRKIQLSSQPTTSDNILNKVPKIYQHLFKEASSINGFNAVGGNSAHLLENSNSTIDSMVKDIDKATKSVNLMFYIWLPDNNGCKMIEALKRAASREVECRAMVDGIGSHQILKSHHWKDLASSGVKVSTALPLKHPFSWVLGDRVDLRNHRKILVIDNKITYCGSQNCADPEFLVKAKYAPWVDAVIRFEGPIAMQNLLLFANDWTSGTGEPIPDLNSVPSTKNNADLIAQAFGTGPTIRYSAMPEMFTSLIYGARSELIITTPYYIPDESMQSALCASAHRGVNTTIIFPQRNDSFVVSAASRSYYEDLLEAGVNIYEYVGGLLHTKSLTIDGEVTLIGSANMDRRSLDLNYENNILFYSPEHTVEMRERQFSYISRSNKISLESVRSWPIYKRLWNNSLAMIGPIL